MPEKFSEQMLAATFEFARVTLSNAILLNGAAATALMAFLANQHAAIPLGFYNSVVRFAVGAGLGGLASMSAYFGQRLDWERSKGPPNGSKVLVNVALYGSAAFGVAAYALFFAGCLAGANALYRR